MRQFQIDGRTITDSSEPLVVAEIGNNHSGSLLTCKAMMLKAKECGASACKLQKRDNKTLYTKAMYNKPYDNPNSYGATYGEHREFLEFSFDQYYELVMYAKEIGITFFATAFDIPSADFLYSLDMPAYKIASADITNIPLITHLKAFGKPLVVSTGGCSIQDVDRAYETLKGSEFCFLHCVASYPNQPENMNLRIIESMRERYPDTVIGLSDHFNGLCISEAAVVLGASVLEKHFTLNHSWKGTDHALSLEPQGLESLCKNVKRIKQALGSREKVFLPSEVEPIKKMGKSVWPTRSIEKGEMILDDSVALKSPGGGLPPYRLEDIKGKIAVCSLSTCDPIKEGDFE